MKTIQNVLIELLSEIDTICNENGITYCLAGRTAESAYLKGIIEEYDTEVILLMTAENASKFIDATAEGLPRNRSVESMLNNPLFPKFGIHYTATDTLYYPLSNTSKYTIRDQGIHIRIEIIRTELHSKFRRAFNDMQEIGWRCNQNPYMGLANPKRFISMVVVRIMMIMGKKNLARHLFNKWARVFDENVDSNSSKNKLYIRPRIRKIMIDKSVVTLMPRTVTLSGVRLPVPRSIFSYAKYDISGKKWPKYDPDVKGEISDKLLYSTSFSFNEYESRLESENVNINKLYKIRRKVQMYAVMVRRENKLKDKAWFIACRSGDRINLLEYYLPRLGRIQYLYDDRNIDDLKKELDKLTVATKFYAGKNLGLCVLPFLTDIQNKLWKIEGEDELIEKVNSLIPEEHKKPIITIEQMKYKTIEKENYAEKEY